MTEFEKEYERELKESIKKFTDGILVDNNEDLRTLKLAYGFARACFRENRAGKEVRADG